MKSYAKINLFLKIKGQMRYANATYHLLQSRFLLLKNLYDEIEIQSSFSFGLDGNFNCPLEENLIYKAYLALLNANLTQSQKRYLQTLRIQVHKQIPFGSGLGGGSSNVATFLHLVNQELQLPSKQLFQIGCALGSDVAFFLSQYEMANVSGRGEQVSECDDWLPQVEILHTGILCESKRVYECYKKNFYAPTDVDWFGYGNQELLSLSPFELNDLLQPALMLYPALEPYVRAGYYLSGSGGSFWRMDENHRPK